MEYYDIELPVSRPEICALRPELMQLYDNATLKQFVHIQAPGGYGKSVSTLLWLKKSGRRAAWRCLDEYDNTPALFYRLMSLSLLSAIPQSEDVAEIITCSAFNDSPVEFTIEFLTRADYGREKTVIVLDDFHAITNETILKSLPPVLKRLPGSVSILFLSRGDMPHSFEQMRENNKISFIGIQELAFRAEEIKKHFESYGCLLTEREAEAVRVYSDGWVILINMMVVAKNFDTDTNKTSITLKNFFERNFWNDLGDDERQFLVKTSIPDRFSIELCEALTCREDSASILNKLVKGNANLSFLNGEYRYHQLFLEFLRDKAVGSAIDLPAVYKLAAEYYIGKNDIVAGRRYAAKSGDFNTIIQVEMLNSKSKNLSLDEYVGLADVYNQNQLPDSICEQMPFLYLPKIYVALLTGNHTDFEYYWDRIYGRMQLLAEKFPQFLENAVTNSISDYRVKFSEYAHHVHAMPAITFRNDIDQVNSPAMQLPFLHRSSRDCHECTEQGVLASAVEGAFRELLKYDCDCMFWGVEAGLYIEQNRLDEARDVLLRSESALSKKVSIDIGWATYILLAETALHKGDRMGYGQYKSKARAYFESSEAYYYSRNFLAYDARVLLWDGDADAAQAWLNQYFINQSEFGFLYKIFQNFTTARAHIVLGDNITALEVLEKIRAVAEAFNRPMDIAEADVLISVTERSMGNKKEARDRLHRVLLSLYPRQFIRIVANEGKAVLPILVSILQKLDKGEKDAEFYKFVKMVHVAAYEQSKRFKGLTQAVIPENIKLSAKQTYVLELLARGYKNVEIVEIAGLSLNTIRTHTKAAYRKLEVTNAMDAIIKAKQLGIL